MLVKFNIIFLQNHFFYLRFFCKFATIKVLKYEISSKYFSRM